VTIYFLECPKIETAEPVPLTSARINATCIKALYNMVKLLVFGAAAYYCLLTGMGKSNASQKGDLSIMPKRILIAEDQIATREALTRHATMRGYEIVAVTNGADLLTIVANEKFDLIITDLIMPDLNGAAATEIMKLQGSTTPVIALTGLYPQDIGLVKDKFAKIFYKPLNDVSELFEYIESLIGK
jgi:two-component system cell cycle response regulator CpdR